MDRIDKARELRSFQTFAEGKLWQLLRGRKLAGLKFRRQVPIDRYIADFACFDARLIVELDGAVHEDRFEQDQRRTDVLRSLGWHVVRFDNEVMLAEPHRVLDGILAELGRSMP
ncbi:MAG: DUF559 domain-containing protein [Caulobacterales bacterium]|nr:DUF559 domain-containing protein [Caulobacterales bacterium]